MADPEGIKPEKLFQTTITPDFATSTDNFNAASDDVSAAMALLPSMLIVQSSGYDGQTLYSLVQVTSPKGPSELLIANDKNSNFAAPPYNITQHFPPTSSDKYLFVTKEGPILLATMIDTTTTKPWINMVGTLPPNKYIDTGYDTLLFAVRKCDIVRRLTTNEAGWLTGVLGRETYQNSEASCTDNDSNPSVLLNNATMTGQVVDSTMIIFAHVKHCLMLTAGRTDFAVTETAIFVARYNLGASTTLHIYPYTYSCVDGDYYQTIYDPITVSLGTTEIVNHIAARSCPTGIYVAVSYDIHEHVDEQDIKMHTKIALIRYVPTSASGGDVTQLGYVAIRPSKLTNRSMMSSINVSNHGHVQLTYVIVVDTKPTGRRKAPTQQETIVLVRVIHRDAFKPYDAQTINPVVFAICYNHILGQQNVFINGQYMTVCISEPERDNLITYALKCKPSTSD